MPRKENAMPQETAETEPQSNGELRHDAAGDPSSTGVMTAVGPIITIGQQAGEGKSAGDHEAQADDAPADDIEPAVIPILIDAEAESVSRRAFDEAAIAAAAVEPTVEESAAGTPASESPELDKPAPDRPESDKQESDRPERRIPEPGAPVAEAPVFEAPPVFEEAPVFEEVSSWQPSGSSLPDGPERKAKNDGPGSEPRPSARREREDGPETAAALTADRLLSGQETPPVAGWRRLLYSASLGYINLGDSDKVRLQRAQEHRIAMRLGQRTRYVPVLSRKGGVGKTTVTTLLGMALADLREDRVIALDANPDRGTLSDRSPGRADYTARHLVKDRFSVNTFSQLAAYAARDGSRLDILASDTDPAIAQAFDDADYRAVTEILSRYYSIVLTDSGTGMVHSVMKGTLEKADAVVLVSGGSVDEARLASETLSWLEAHGRHDLVAKAIVVVNMSAGEGTLVNIEEIEQHFRSRVKSVLRLPYDRHLAEGSRVSLDRLKPATRAAVVELAALVVDELQGL